MWCSGLHARSDSHYDLSTANAEVRRAELVAGPHGEPVLLGKLRVGRSPTSPATLDRCDHAPSFGIFGELAVLSEPEAEQR